MKPTSTFKAFIFLILSILPFIGYAADPNIPAFIVENQSDGTTTYSLSLKILAAMTALTFIPAILMTTTSFTRFIIVFTLLRQALGVPNVPSNQILLGLALFMTIFVMSPIFMKINNTALQPYLDKKITEVVALENATAPIRQFMTKQTRKSDVLMLEKISGTKVTDPNNIPFSILMPAFLLSEIKTAFIIGFILFIPFLIIDLVVASVLMSMGMVMLSPLVISLPFKIMLFVLVDGWTLIVGTLTTSFVT